MKEWGLKLNKSGWGTHFKHFPVPRVVVKLNESIDFLFLLNDLFLLYDAETSVLQARVPGSLQLQLKLKKMQQNKKFFDELIGEVIPIQQVFS